MNKIAFTIGGNQIVAPPNVPSGGLYNGGEHILQQMVGAVFIIAIFVAFASLILVGIRWTISEGKKEKLQEVKDQLIFTIIGLIVVFLAIFIVRLVGGIVGVPLFQGT